MLPSNKFGAFIRRKAFLLCKNPCGRAAIGDGGLIAEGSPPRKEISRGNLLCAESGLPSLSYPRLQRVQKVRSTPNRYNRLYRAAQDARGAAPLCFLKSPEETLSGVSSGQFLRGGSTPRFFAQLRSVGSNQPAGRFLPESHWRLPPRTAKTNYIAAFIKANTLSQEVIDPQNLRPRLARQSIGLHAKLPRQILCPAEMEITRDDENRRCIHAVLFGEHAGIPRFSRVSCA